MCGIYGITENNPKIIREIIKNKDIYAKTLLNINIPDFDSENISFEHTRLGKRGLPLPATKERDNLYKIGAAGPPEDYSKGTDFFCIKENKISITPLTYDLTNYEVLKITNKKWILILKNSPEQVWLQTHHEII